MSWIKACRLPPAAMPLDSLSLPVLCEFKAPYDRLVKAITSALIVGLLALIVGFSYLALSEREVVDFIALAIVIVIVIPTLIVPYLYSPRAFGITAKGVLVKRPLKSFLIPYEDIASVKRVSWTWKGIRLFASGGLYGYFGLFQISGLGRAWMYVTNRDKMLLIETKRGVKYIISPSDPELFMEKLKSMGVTIEGL
ncbi:MAG: PH domain-containing protein [Candidatus Nezhaarchaeales archaeon]